MAENLSELLAKAEQALADGKDAQATKLFKRILDQDFNHQPTWELLHRRYGRNLPFSEFQRTFAKKYFPDQVRELGKKRVDPSRQLEEELREAAGERRSFFGRLLAALTRPFRRKRKEAPQPEPTAPEVREPEQAAANPAAAASPAPRPSQPFVPRGTAPPPAPTPHVRSHPPTPASPVYRSAKTGQKIRVVVVDDIAETRNNVVRSLTFEEDVEVVGTAASGTEGIRVAEQSDPDVILMDVNMPDMDGITATARIREKLPLAQIIILTVQDDLDYMRKAMRAGARDFLTKPPMIDELLNAVLRAGEMAHQERLKKQPAQANPSGLAPQATEGQIISLYSPKGGTGCTTLAANLAATLHGEDTPVLLVDADLQFGDVGVLFNAQGRNTIVDLALRARELDPQVVEEVVVTHTSGIHLLIAPRPEQAESVTPDQLSQLLGYLSTLYAYVIVDTSSRLSDNILAVLEASDLVVALLTQDIPSIANLRKFLDLVPLVNLDSNRVLIAMNLYDKRVGITPEKIGQTFKRPISAVIPQEAATVVPSVNRGSPFMLQSQSLSKPVGRAMLDLAEAVRSKLSQLEVAESQAEEVV